MKKDLCIPVSSLETPDYNSGPAMSEGKHEPKMIAPEKGDIVDFHVQGIVSKVEGKMVYVTPKKINGSKMDNSEDEPEEEDGESEGDDEKEKKELMAEAQQADGNLST